jgi:hypothetical protein
MAGTAVMERHRGQDQAQPAAAEARRAMGEVGGNDDRRRREIGGVVFDAPDAKGAQSSA